MKHHASSLSFPLARSYTNDCSTGGSQHGGLPWQPSQARGGAHPSSNKNEGLTLTWLSHRNAVLCDICPKKSLKLQILILYSIAHKAGAHSCPSQDLAAKLHIGQDYRDGLQTHFATVTREVGSSCGRVDIYSHTSFHADHRR